MPCKYGLLITNWMGGTHRAVPYASNAQVRWWGVEALDPSHEVDAWRKAFGTLQWQEIQRSRACFIATAEDDSAVTNTINDELLVRARVATYAFLVNRPPMLAGGWMWMVSGLADENSPSTLDRWIRLPEFYNAYFPNRPLFAPDMTALRTNTWIDAWLTDFASMESGADPAWLISGPVEIAVLSLWDASTEPTIDFRFPSLVRAIEALIAIPAGSGMKRTFIDRARRFCGDVQAHPAFIASGKTIENLLSALYVLRSRVVHGSWPLREMQADQKEDEVALLEFTAETVARTAIKWALKNSAVFASYRSRAELEDAWRLGQVPSP